MGLFCQYLVIKILIEMVVDVLEIVDIYQSYVEWFVVVDVGMDLINQFGLVQQFGEVVVLGLVE